MSCIVKIKLLEYYDDGLLVLNVNKLPFEFSENIYAKRTFDILFSLMICVFLLSWLVPILWVLVKLESKGPLIFKQKREGFKGKEFICYKFRSMKINDLSDKIHASKNDVRVTKIGAFLRKTSMDELPQFHKCPFWSYECCRSQASCRKLVFRVSRSG
jgi:putative colanic acid biosynthesis UDP-glucose lipid carrier transferase